MRPILIVGLLLLCFSFFFILYQHKTIDKIDKFDGQNCDCDALNKERNECNTRYNKLSYDTNNFVNQMSARVNSIDVKYQQQNAILIKKYNELLNKLNQGIKGQDNADSQIASLNNSFS